MSSAAYERIASDLRAAYSRGQIEPIAGRFGAFDIGDAYLVQEINTRAWVSEGRVLVGRKIGMASQAVQRQLGVGQPSYGMLFDTMQIPNGAEVRDLLHQPRVEAEIAIKLGQDLTESDVCDYDVIDAIDWIAPAIEIVDSRIDSWRISILDTIADNASSALFAIGEQRSPLEFDVTNFAMRFCANGEQVSCRQGNMCFGTPYRATTWLARKMIDLGFPLRAGDVVLTGALGPMVPAKRDTQYSAEIGDMCAVSVSF